MIALASLVAGWTIAFGLARYATGHWAGASSNRWLTRHLPFITELIAATGLLALAVIGFFWQILLTSTAWMPAGGGDLAPFLYPNYRFAAEQLRQGSLPLWNPHLYSGTPFAADIQSGLFYPINLLVFLLVPELTYEWLEYLALFHFWLAGATMYLCLRCLILSPEPDQAETPPAAVLSPLAAFAGALAFQFSDLFIVHFGNLNMIAVAAWLPLVFLLFQRSLAGRSLGLSAAAGAVLAVATLAGHIQITLFILLTLGLYTLYALWPPLQAWGGHFLALQPAPLPTASLPTGRRLTAWLPLPALFICLLTTIGLAALLLVPAYEMSRYTPRAELPYPEAAAYSLHPVQLVGLLVPNFFGRDPALHWGPWERVETGYIGLLTLMLALLGAVLRPGRLKGFFIGLGLIALLLAWGGYSLLHGWLYAFIPGFDQLRAPARFILLLDFALATLAAFGLDQLMRPLTDQARSSLAALLKGLTWLGGGLIVVAGPLSYFALLITQDRNPAIFNRAAGAAAGVAIFALFTVAALVVLHLARTHRLRGLSLGLAAVAVIGLDLFTLGYNLDVGRTDPTAGFNHPEALAFLQQDPNPFRLEVTTDVWHAWQPNTAMLHGLYDVWGLYNPLTLADTTLYWSGAPPRHTGRYNFLGIKYIIASKAGAPADGDIVSVFEGDPQINIYLNQAALARVLFVGRATVVADHDAAWQAIRAEDFDPASRVFLEGGQPLNNQPRAGLAILNYGRESLTIAVETD
ncbi:MAG TPA: hypothetical protein PKD98_16975, partial [Anaerolineae bacterium]|nr:hypothetical protein [Anaerolineae bacterium]